MFLRRTFLSVLVLLVSNFAVADRAADPIANARAEVDVGAVPPDMLGTDRDEHEVRISSFRGKVVVVSFWASWCRYCREELPVLEKIQRVLGKSRIEVIAVNTDRNRRDYLAMRRQLRDFQLTLARDEDQGVSDRYGVKALPYLLMIDKSGRIARKYVGYSTKVRDSFPDEINALLDEPDVQSIPQPARD